MKFIFGKNKLKAGVLAAVVLLAAMFAMTGCGSGKKEKILIYTSAEDYIIEYLNGRLSEEFPNYDINVEYMSTGNLAAKLAAEGTKTDCDIIQQLEYGYLEQLDKQGVLADLSEYDKSIYMDDTNLSDNYIIQCRVGGTILVNTELLQKKNLPEPTCYADLLKPEYKGLISMPNPKASGTGYMFYKNLVNAWGEEKALKYFDDLSPNVLQYTSSGSGPVNALIQGEAVIGLGMTSQTVMQINNKAPLKTLFFEEGSPFSLYGQSMIKGKDERAAVKEVFDFLVKTYTIENCERFYPEKIYKDKDFTLDNYPKDIKFGDMSNNTIEEKNRLLELWKY